MPHATLISFFQLVQLLGVCLAIYKLLATGIYRRYPFFFAYLLYRLPVLVCFPFLDTKSPLYFYFWVVTTPLSWVFFILVVRELYGLVLARHRGLYTLGRWVMYLGIAVAIGFSIVSKLSRFTSATTQTSKYIGYFYAVDQGVDLSLATFLILMLLLLSQYFSVLSRNVVAHAVLFAVWFLCNSIGSILRSTFGFKQYASIEAVRMGFLGVCSLGWYFLMSAKGEAPRKTLPALEERHESVVMSQLDALNKTLLKSGKI